MINMFGSMDANGLKVELSDGRLIPLEDLVKGYERLLDEENSKKVITSEPNEEIPKDAVKSKSKDEKVVRPEVGKWFLVDRDVIDKNKEEIRRKCMEVGELGEEYWERFERTDKRSGHAPFIYPRLFETYIFENTWELENARHIVSDLIESVLRSTQLAKLEQMCKEVGDGMCNAHICDYELQMRICNGESTTELFKRGDTLPRRRIIKTGYLDGDCYGLLGGGYADWCSYTPPAYIKKCSRSELNPGSIVECFTPYAFRALRW